MSRIRNLLLAVGLLGCGVCLLFECLGARWRVSPSSAPLPQMATSDASLPEPLVDQLDIATLVEIPPLTPPWQGGQESPTTNTPPVPASESVGDDTLDQLWQQAKASAAQEQWGDAVRSARRALDLHRAQLADQPLPELHMLEAISYWNAQQREFVAAVDAAIELEQRREQLFGADHWQTVDARLNVAVMERLSQLTDEEWRQFQIADEQSALAATLQQAGKHADALDLVSEAVPVYSTLLGREAGPTLACLSNAVICLLDLGKYERARPYVVELIEAQPRIKGMLHPDTVLGLQLLARYNEAIGNLSNAEDALRKVVELATALAGPDHADTISARVDLAKLLSDRDRFDEAQSILVTALQQQSEMLGDDHPATAQTMKVLGALHCKQRRFAEAKPLLERSVAVFRQHLGDKHLATASALNALGRLRLDMGQFREAARDLEESLGICRNALGDFHPVCAKVLDNLAWVHEQVADTGQARRYRLRCLEIAEESFGEMNMLTADALEHVARTYIVMNDYGLAETYLLRARHIRRTLLGEAHPKTATVVGNLAYVYLGAGDPARAEPLFHEALNFLEGDTGTGTSNSARIRGNLALLYQSVGKFDDAEAQYRQALRTAENLPAPDFVVIADAKAGLAQTLMSRGDCSESCRLIDDVLDLYGKALHPDDPQWLDALGIAGTAYLAAGEPDKAERLLARALHVAQRRMEMAGAFESERQRISEMQLLRASLDLYLSVSANVQTSSGDVYPLVLAWKGAIACRQWYDRQHENEDTAPLTAELQQVCRQLATLSLQVPDAADRREWIGRIFALNMRKEALEQQRAVLSAKPNALVLRPSTEELRRVLPAGTALIDILQYTHTSFGPEQDVPRMQREERYLAFIVRGDRPVERIDLGEAEPIADAVLSWRQTRGFRPDPGKTDWAAVVGERLWLPLRPQVEDCDTLLISPDGRLSQLAWNALPGRAAGTYLIEDFAIAMAPAPQLLPALLAMERPQAPQMPESLLLVGNIDYDAAPSANSDANPSPERIALLSFDALQGTAAEVQALREQYERRHPDGNVLLLDQAAATEAAFWRAAPRHRWIHIATHGFFAPPSLRSALAAQTQMDPQASQRTDTSIFHVNYLNGVALAGANVGATDDGDDGILTAAELANMDLRHVELVVLSGCETGLGELQDGEGAFGMQRALQTAGVNATVGSLWTVPDAKTNLLMQRFYANLWDKQLSKLAALRDAQLWMLNTGSVPENASTAKTAKRLSPHYWAAFTLSGDWR